MSVIIASAKLLATVSTILHSQTCRWACLRVSKCTCKETPWTSPLVVGPIKSLDRRVVDFRLFPDIHTQPFVCDDIVDVNHCLQETLVQKFALVSIAHLQDHVDASGDPARDCGVVRSLVSSEMELHSQLARLLSRRWPSRIHCSASMCG